MRPPTHYLKQAFKSAAVQGLGCFMVSLGLRLVHLLGRWRVEGDESARALWRARKPFILCFWHNRLLMMPFAWNPPWGAGGKNGAPINMLISAHQDGRLIARTVGHFGISTIAGSDNRNTTSAIRAMVRAMERGECIGITPDSPPGPRMRAKDGVAVLARLAGVPVVPVGYSCTHRRVLNTWDRLVVPLPFSGGLFLWGKPIAVPSDADGAALERARAEIEAALTALSDEADRRCGQEPIAPGPPLSAADGAALDARAAE
jgi:lysophospholipid acyltransferase (LPLAT)-like uncharacterized protein